MLNVLITMYFYRPPANEVSASGLGGLPLVRGVSASGLGTDAPLGRQPPGRHPPGQTSCKYTPTWVDTPPWGDTPLG